MAIRRLSRDLSHGGLLLRVGKGPAPNARPALGSLHPLLLLAGRWIDGRGAFYARIPDLKTPMASGLAAYASREDALKAGGTLMAFQDLSK